MAAATFTAWASSSTRCSAVGRRSVVPYPVLVPRILHEPPPRPRSIDPAIPRDLEVICLKAIAKDRRERYGSAREMADDLNRVLAWRADPGLPGGSRPQAALLGPASPGRWPRCR